MVQRGVLSAGGAGSGKCCRCPPVPVRFTDLVGLPRESISAVHLRFPIAETWDYPLDTAGGGGGGKRTKMGAQSRYYAPDRSGVRCYNCDQTGHMSFDCPKPRKMNPCHKCGNTGHHTDSECVAHKTTRERADGGCSTVVLKGITCPAITVGQTRVFLCSA